MGIVDARFVVFGDMIWTKTSCYSLQITNVIGVMRSDILLFAVLTATTTYRPIENCFVSNKGRIMTTQREI